MIAGQVRVQNGRLWAAAVAGALVSAASVGLLGLSGWFIVGSAIAGAGGLMAVQAFNYLLPSACIRLLAIVRTAARYGERVAGHEAALNALARMRPALFDALAAAPPERSMALSSGETSARLVQDVDAIQTLFVRLSSPWSLGAGAVSAIGLALLASPLAGLAILTAMTAAVLGAAVLGRVLADPAGREAQAATGALKARLTALEAATPELRAYGLEGWASEQAAEAGAALDEAVLRGATAGGWMTAWQAAVGGAAVAGAVVAASSAPAPLIALAALCAVTGVEAAAGLATALRQRGAAEAAIERLDRLAAPDPQAGRGGRPEGDEIQLLTVGLRLTPPMRLAIGGASGAGKTTLVERMLGLRASPGGEVMVGSVDLADMAPGGQRPLFAYAAQTVQLIEGSVRDNLALADPEATEAQMSAALVDVGLDGRLGLDTPLGVDGERLSGGERRRLALARAWLRPAAWLVLDEPTEGLDAATETRVLAALDRRLGESGQGLILISHRPAPVALCDTLVVVEGIGGDGRIDLRPMRVGVRSRPGRWRAGGRAVRYATRSGTTGG